MSEICAKCGLPKDLCVCETIAREEQKVTITLVKKRFAKLATTISGLDERSINLKDLAKRLKTKLACGGTLKEGVIELQGNHIEKVKEELKNLGFNLESLVVRDNTKK